MDYICNICGKSFETKQKLGGHKTIHLPKKDYICEYCGRSFHTTESAFQHHVTNHKKISSRDISLYNQPQDNLFCCYCGQKWDTLNKLKNHEAWCEQNPNHRSKDIFNTSSYKNRKLVSWNKGLTKETDERIKKQCETYNKNKELGLHKSNSHPHTETTKETLRQKALSNSYQRVCKKTVEYIKKDGSVVKLDSTFEIKTAEILDKLDIDWVRPSPLIWIDKNNKEHHYFPDFYLTKEDIYLDPKNEYCFKVQAEKIDYVRNHYDNVIFLTGCQITEDFIKTLVGMM